MVKNEFNFFPDERMNVRYERTYNEHKAEYIRLWGKNFSEVVHSPTLKSYVRGMLNAELQEKNLSLASNPTESEIQRLRKERDTVHDLRTSLEQSLQRSRDNEIKYNADTGDVDEWFFSCFGGSCDSQWIFSGTKGARCRIRQGKGQDDFTVFIDGKEIYRGELDFEDDRGKEEESLDPDALDITNELIKQEEETDSLPVKVNKNDEQEDWE